jgi:hypothetical protein
MIIGIVTPAAAVTKSKVVTPKKEDVFKLYASAYERTLKEQRYSIKSSFPSLNGTNVIQHDVDYKNGLFRNTIYLKENQFGFDKIIEQYQGDYFYSYDEKLNKYHEFNGKEQVYRNQFLRRFEVARKILTPYANFLKTAKGVVKSVNGLKEITVTVPKDVATKVYRDIQIGTNYKNYKETMQLAFKDPNLDSEMKKELQVDYEKQIKNYERMLKNTFASEATLVIMIDKEGYIRNVTEKFNLYFQDSKYKNTIINNVSYQAFGEKVKIKPIEVQEIYNSVSEEPDDEVIDQDFSNGENVVIDGE